MDQTEIFELCLWFLGVAVGIHIGWLIWRLPQFYRSRNRHPFVSIENVRAAASKVMKRPRP